MSDDLTGQLEAAQAAYQALYNQYQQERAAINTWQTRMREENERLRATLEDFAKHGTRFDMTPTHIVASEAVERFWHEYIQRIDDSVSERAHQALKGN